MQQLSATTGFTLFLFMSVQAAAGSTRVMAIAEA